MQLLPMLPIITRGGRGIVMDGVATALTYALLKSAIAVSHQMHLNGFLHLLTHMKIVHVLMGLIPMLFWPFFSDHYRGRVLVSLVPFLCVGMPLLIHRSFEEQQFLESFEGRYRSPVDFFKAMVGYHGSYIFTTVFFWKSPIAISTLCNLCAGDGVAAILGRRYGKRFKLPHNKSKSFAGTIGMAVVGFLASTLFMSYFSWMGIVELEVRGNMVYGFMVVSIASAAVESHPWSSRLDDNLTVPLASMLVGPFVF